MGFMTTPRWLFRISEASTVPLVSQPPKKAKQLLCHKTFQEHDSWGSTTCPVTSDSGCFSLDARGWFKTKTPHEQQQPFEPQQYNNLTMTPIQRMRCYSREIGKNTIDLYSLGIRLLTLSDDGVYNRLRNAKVFRFHETTLRR